MRVPARVPARVEREHEVAAEAETGLARDHRGREHGLLHPQVQHAKVDHQVADPRRGEVCQQDALALVRQPPTQIGGGGDDEHNEHAWIQEPAIPVERPVGQRGEAPCPQLILTVFLTGALSKA